MTTKMGPSGRSGRFLGPKAPWSHVAAGGSAKVAEEGGVVVAASRVGLVVSVQIRASF